MDIRLKSYQLLLAVAEERSFSRAAQRLHVTQPWVSTQIRQWEQEAGFPIFVRSNHPAAPVELTERGIELLQQAQQVLAEADRLMATMQRLRADSRPVRIGTDPITVQIRERMLLIEQAAAILPGVELQIQNFDDERTFVELRRGNLDIGLIIGPNPDPAIYQSRVLRKLRVDLLIPCEHPLAKFEYINAQQLVGQQLMICTRATHPMSALVKKFWEQAGAIVIESVEPHVIATMRIAQRLRMITTTFEESAANAWGLTDMVQRPIAGLALELNFQMVARRESVRGNIERFWALADKIVNPAD